MLTKKQTFELYTKIMKMKNATFNAGADFKDEEAQHKAVNTLVDVLQLLRKNCKDDFWEWPDEVEK